MGPKTARKILDRVEQAPDPLAFLGEISVPSVDAESWQAFVELMYRLCTRSDWPAEIEFARRWYEPHLQRLHEAAVIRGEDLLQLERIAATYPSRERFLTELTLDPPEASSDEAGIPLLDEDYLILSTIHSAKGQEWNAVYVLSAVDGCLPSDLSTGSTEEIEEERRLLYVAMTRAKEELAILVPQRFYLRQQAAYGDAHVYASRTRFIPSGLLCLFDCQAWPVPAYQPVASHSAGPGLIDLAARVREMWG